MKKQQPQKIVVLPSVGRPDPELAVQWLLRVLREVALREAGAKTKDQKDPAPDPLNI